MAIQIIQKELEGVIKIIPTTPTDYYFVVPTNGVLPQNTNISNTVLQDVFILSTLIDYSSRIFLPKISSFKGQWNAKIFISLLDDFGEINVIAYNDVDEVNTINRTLSNVDLKGGYFQIADDNNWLFFKAY